LVTRRVSEENASNSSLTRRVTKGTSNLRRSRVAKNAVRFVLWSDLKDLL